MTSTGRTTLTLVGAAAACMAVREGARAFAAPGVVIPEEIAVSSPALRGAAVEPATSSSSMPIAALTVAAVGATAAKVNSRRRTTQSRAQAVVRNVQVGGVQVSSATDAKTLADLITQVAAKVLESEGKVAQTEALLAEKEAALLRIEAVSTEVQVLRAQLAAAEEAKNRAEARAAAGEKGLAIMEESAKLYFQSVQEIKKLAATASHELDVIDSPFMTMQGITSGGAGAPITEAEVRNALNEWGQGIVDIGTVFRGYGDFKTKAAEMIRRLYAYDLYPVLFKPTKASQQPFRPTFEGALSYFVGGNPAFSEDHGFAIKPWSKVRIEPGTFSLHDDTATVMGNYWFSDYSFTETKVEFTFGYKRDSTGKLRIILHHSSLPYSH